jgi:hypothetical protein
VRADLRPGHPSEDTITGVSELTGGAGDDVLIGDDQPNRISGGEGQDQVVGLGGNDYVAGDDASGGAGDDEVLGGKGAVTPRCGPGQDVVLTSGDSLVGEDCERVGADALATVRPRLRLPGPAAVFLSELHPCVHAGICEFEGWKATAHGRVVASAGATDRRVKLNARGRRLLRREGKLRLRVTHTVTSVELHTGRTAPVRLTFRLDLRL